MTVTISLASIALTFTSMDALLCTTVLLRMTESTVGAVVSSTISSSTSPIFPALSVPTTVIVLLPSFNNDTSAE